MAAGRPGRQDLPGIPRDGLVPVRALRHLLSQQSRVPGVCAAQSAGALPALSRRGFLSGHDLLAGGLRMPQLPEALPGGNRRGHSRLGGLGLPCLARLRASAGPVAAGIRPGLHGSHQGCPAGSDGGASVLHDRHLLGERRHGRAGGGLRFLQRRLLRRLPAAELHQQVLPQRDQNPPLCLSHRPLRPGAGLPHHHQDR